MAHAGSDIDLSAYFRRIGYAGAREPTIEVLRSVHLAHVKSIPYENVDLHLGRRLQLQLPAIEKKFIEEERGGYCFEHNLYFAAVLRALGLDVTLLAARVRWLRAPEEPSGLSHGILKVIVEGRPWLADVGFGSVSLTAPLTLDVEDEQTTPHEPRRLVWRNGQRIHQVKLSGAWVDVYAFTEEPQSLPDWMVYNWYTETHPASRFVQNLIVARAFDDCRATLAGFEFTKRFPDGTADKKLLASEEERLAVLSNVFGIQLPRGEVLRPPLTATWALT